MSVTSKFGHLDQYVAKIGHASLKGPHWPKTAMPKLHCPVENLLIPTLELYVSQEWLSAKDGGVGLITCVGQQWPS